MSLYGTRFLLAVSSSAVALALAACGSEGREEPDAGASVPALDAAAGPSPDAAFGSADAGTGSSAPDAASTGLGVLGWGSHAIGAVEVVEIGSRADGLNVPRDLAFNPDRAGELWVVNRADDSTVIYFDPGTPSQRSEKRTDPFAMHFMEEVSSIAFGAPGTFGTCQESNNTYDGQARANDFMGPSLWPSDLTIYARTNPAAVRALGADLGSHLDMLHESPWCMGIAWDHDNVYWTFDGATGSISRYDFQRDHGPGFDDHSDGTIDRYVTGEVARVPNVPSHLELDPRSRLLYVADTGNARIAVLDTNTGARGPSMRVKEPGTTLTRVDGAMLTTLADNRSGELLRPSGLLLAGDLLYVTDNAIGRITAFTLAGERVDWLDTGLPDGALMGIAADAEGRLYVTDAIAGRVLRIAPRP